MADAVRRGGVVAYPTEAVFGLGCDPFNTAAVQRLYRLKRRPTTQGFLLIAASEAQFGPFVDWARLAPGADLCRAVGGALVSTSANRHGQPAARSVDELWQQFADADLDALLDLPLGGLDRPTPIRDALSGRSLRGA